ncbi:hypothetical protein ACHAW5_005907 [Stephanodiscus triporus]|uniref:PDZ domain-containing protein n=1 Tax=Stephanodiscus triporus TaxID=2934178 RepID=A0ABD3NA01_9STRA
MMRRRRGTMIPHKPGLVRVCANRDDEEPPSSCPCAVLLAAIVLVVVAMTMTMTTTNAVSAAEVHGGWTGWGRRRRSRSDRRRRPRRLRLRRDERERDEGGRTAATHRRRRRGTQGPGGHPDLLLPGVVRATVTPMPSTAGRRRRIVGSADSRRDGSRAAPSSPAPTTGSTTSSPTATSSSSSPVANPTTDEPTPGEEDPSPTTSPTDSPVVVVVVPATEAPTPGEDLPAVAPPTTRPVDDPTPKPTATPTRKPSPIPTDEPTPSPSDDPPTLEPTDDPSPKPTKAPTKKPSPIPTDGPNPSQPVVVPTTPPPVVAPTPVEGQPAASPTESPVVNADATPPTATDDSPTDAPTPPENEAGSPPPASPTASPTVRGSPAATTEGPTFDLMYSFSPTPLGRRGPLRTAGLTMTLVGIGKIESVPDWEKTTSGFFEDVYDNDRPGGMYDVMVGVTMTGANGANDGSGRALLQSNEDDAVVVTYVQETWYSIDESDWEPDDDFVLVPLSTESRRDEYVGTLKSLSGYEYLTDVSEISVASSHVDGVISGEESSSGGVATMGAVIGISVLCAVLLLAAIVAGIVRYNKGFYDDGDVDVNDILPTSKPQEVETTVGTVDYDYAAAFGGAGDHSLSDVGGTVGSRTRQTGADVIEKDLPTMAPPGSGNTVFSEDPTFDQAYEDVYESLLDVYAPAGKLGVIIDTPDDGAPMIHAIKDDSPIVDRVRVGDKLVAVDDEDVRPMTARKVSKLISTKMNNPSRKLTIIRQERRAGPVG